MLVGLVKDHTCIQALALSRQHPARSVRTSAVWHGDHQDIETTNIHFHLNSDEGFLLEAQDFLGLKVRIMTQFFTLCELRSVDMNVSDLPKGLSSLTYLH